MTIVNQQITVATHGQGLFEFTGQVQEIVKGARIRDGLCTVFVQHTSASIIIQENADPSARRDLEVFLNHLVPEGFPGYTHTSEGADDMPAHIKAALTATSIAIPVVDGGLGLGTWQGIYLWEHRSHRGRRRVLVHVAGE